MNNDIVNQLSWFITNECRMPAGFTITVIEEIERLRAEVARQRQRRTDATMALSAAEALANLLRALVAEQHDGNERLRAELADWQGTVRAHEHAGHELRDEIERRRAQVMELLPWAESGAEAQAETTTGDRRQAALDLLDRIEAGKYF